MISKQDLMKLAEYFPYSDSDTWHIGEWKKSGIVLFKKKVVKGYNLVLRIVGSKGWAFLEEGGVTEGLQYLELDQHILENGGTVIPKKPK